MQNILAEVRLSRAAPREHPATPPLPFHVSYLLFHVSYLLLHVAQVLFPLRTAQHLYMWEDPWITTWIYLALVRAVIIFIRMFLIAFKMDHYVELYLALVRAVT